MISLPYARRGFRYNNYKYYLEDHFGERVQRVSVEGGFTCPNRDGTLGTTGCIYCNNRSFSPPYADGGKPVAEQLSEGIRFLSQRFGAEKFIAYFQSQCNTYAAVDRLEKLYREALDHPKIVGLAVSTRPDCINDENLGLLKSISRHHDVNLEMGIESVYDDSLKWMNRCHDLSVTVKAIQKAAEYGLNVTGHIILGLPCETREKMLDTAAVLNRLPLTFLKLHHLQIIRGTPLAVRYKKQAFPLFDYREYIEFIAEFISRLRPDIILQRVISSSPENYLIAPQWQPTTTAFIMDLQKYMREKEIWQGDKYTP
ncbi:MAG: TIGR01212 family radical SAM protein [Candidatus Marinimicrobia bacterium]|nr:TIGR01212 family radical SAM protein [Candidatus Neomarinimicrobiota bacterium]